MQIINMTELNELQLEEAAVILTTSIPQGWPSMKEACEEIRERLIPENCLLAAVEDETVLGWGGILAPMYDGRVFELHPLAVRNDRRNQGIGRAIVTALEDQARSRGGLTMFLGADDESEDGETSLADVDLYEDLGLKFQNFEPGTHQSGFYLKLGYKLVGVIPDANGIGRPDIFMAKRLSR